ncbi:hypothetical protein F4821DRAFT_259329 [Hypoxylon rubiginosum]|uniref:Uncharacterized protein n=1 Tax=Hypoxylon rubiginosum TaxID=110542 RepID=A0ACC0D349_9PEZI|nr:hypothetical protein F4821DRAFT_259329 [Hypoxylon rubiginosum]
MPSSYYKKGQLQTPTAPSSGLMTPTTRPREAVLETTHTHPSPTQPLLFEPSTEMVYYFNDDDSVVLSLQQLPNLHNTNTTEHRPWHCVMCLRLGISSPDDEPQQTTPRYDNSGDTEKGTCQHHTIDMTSANTWSVTENNDGTQTEKGDDMILPSPSGVTSTTPGSSRNKMVAAHATYGNLSNSVASGAQPLGEDDAISLVDDLQRHSGVPTEEAALKARVSPPPHRHPSPLLPSTSTSTSSTGPWPPSPSSSPTRPHTPRENGQATEASKLLQRGSPTPPSLTAPTQQTTRTHQVSGALHGGTQSPFVLPGHVNGQFSQAKTFTTPNADGGTEAPDHHVLGRRPAPFPSTGADANHGGLMSDPVLQKEASEVGQEQTQEQETGSASITPTRTPTEREDPHAHFGLIGSVRHTSHLDIDRGPADADWDTSGDTSPLPLPRRTLEPADWVEDSWTYDSAPDSPELEGRSNLPLRMHPRFLLKWGGDDNWGPRGLPAYNNNGDQSLGRYTPTSPGTSAN